VVTATKSSLAKQKVFQHTQERAY